MNPRAFNYTRALSVALLTSIIVSPTLFLVGTVAPVSAAGTVPSTLGPGTGTILVHEYGDDLNAEMSAFETGNLDIVDGDVPSSFLQAWMGPASDPRSIITQGKVATSKSTVGGMFQIDINNWNILPTGDVSFRRALGYLLDRQRIVTDFAGGRAAPICGGVSAFNAGAKDCVRLGYPTSYGDFSPSKALQVLYEGGWRDSNNNGILEAPNGSEPTLIFIIRSDDALRKQAGQLLTSQLQNLPRSFMDKTGITVVVCSRTGTCGINVDAQLLARSTAVSIVLRSPWNDWNLYTGGWSSAADASALPLFYGSDNAPIACGGSFPSSLGVLNYPCNVDHDFDQLASGITHARTYDELLAASGRTQDYAWGYDGPAGKITGTMPTVPMYSLLVVKPAWLTDQGATPLANPDGSRACWAGFVDQDLGEGLDNYWSLTGLHLNNCKPAAEYVSYRGDPRSVLDYGLISPIQKLNPVSPESFSDFLVTQLVYDSLLTYNPVSPKEVAPLLASAVGEATYFNSVLGQEATVAVFELRKDIVWNDGTPFTGADAKFSFEYIIKTYGYYNFGLQDVYDVQVVSNPDGSESVIVHFDDIGVSFATNAGVVPLFAKHVWCPDYNPSAGLDVGYGIAPRPGCPYPDPSLFPDFDFTKHVGTGPYRIAECTGVDCSQTITLHPNPYYTDGTRYWSLAAGISLQPDVNRDGRVNQLDLDLLSKVDANDQRFDVDYRLTSKGTLTFLNSHGPGSLTVSLQGPVIDGTDRYIVQRLVFEGQQQALPNGINWPPGKRLTYTWPDVDRDNDVDLDDLIGVYLQQFQPPTPVSAISINDVDYNGDIDLDDLILTFVHQFTKPVGVV